MTLTTGYINPYVHVNYVRDVGAPPCAGCGTVMDDWYTAPNRCGGCLAAHHATLLKVVEGGEVSRDAAGVLRRHGVPLVVDDVQFLYGLIGCGPGGMAHLTEAGRNSAWRR
jgi:hypothetical protein